MDETLPPQNLFAGAVDSSLPHGAALETREFRERPPPEILGSYRVLEPLGQGGMGIVYKCVDDALKRHVAVKVLRERFARDETHRRRFLREAQAIASVSHPSVAHVYGVGEFEHSGERLAYIAMEYVDGSSLETAIERRGRIPWREAVDIGREAAMGLAEAHSRGIVHRDVKPSNLLVTASGHVKIVDFGLAKDVGGVNSITDEGMIVGTPHYISPEQGRGKTVDHRSDIYSLGASLYHMVAGRPPFEGTSQVSVIVAHVNDPPRRLEEIEPSVPPGLVRVIGRMMHKDPANRYPTYAALIADLALVGAGKEPTGAGPIESVPAPAAVESPGRRWILRAALGLALTVPAIAVAAFVLLARGDGPPLPPELNAIRTPLEDGRELFDWRFVGATEPRIGAEARSRLLLFAPAPAGAEAPAVQESGLVWRNYTSPLALRPIFQSVDECGVALGATAGTFDFAIAISDPAGAQARLLLLRLRPGESTPFPLVARRQGVETAVGLPPVPRLGQGPFEILLGFARGGGRTTIEINIVRKPTGRSLYRASGSLEGEDWASGVVLVRTDSPIHPFSVAMERIFVAGRLAATPLQEEPPWHD